MIDLSNAKFVADSTFGEWAMYESENRFYFKESYEGGNWARTPGGQLLTTEYKGIAKKLLNDLDSFGANYTGGDSSIPWQYTYIDSFSGLSHEEVENQLEQTFLSKPDWTLDAGIESNESLKELFGIEPNKRSKIRIWLSKCSHLQMTAACCIGNAFHSLNIAYSIAESFEIDNMKEYVDKLDLLANVVASMLGIVPWDVKATMRLFELYYSIDFHAIISNIEIWSIPCNNIKMESGLEAINKD